MTPPEELRATAAQLRELAAKVRAEVKASDYFGHDIANFSEGIRNACGGASGDLAALMSPEVAESIAAVLEEAADRDDCFKEDLTPARAASQISTIDRELDVVRAISGSRPASEPKPAPEEPVCEWFVWIGQSFAHCDNCSRPAWRHRGELVPGNPFDDSNGTHREWQPGQADAIRAKWGRRIAIDMAWHSAWLETRDQGYHLLTAFRDRMQDWVEATVVLDFSRVQSITATCADAWLPDLVTSLQAAHNLVTIREANPAVRKSLQLVLERREIDTSSLWEQP